jgi:pimeloyl-ACP methyl ester carboxylesterase
MKTSGIGRQAMAMHPEIHVEESGTPGSPAVVFLHGAGASGRMWREHLTRLQGAFQCLAPDFPGFGRSNHLPSASRTETADLVAELIESRVPECRAHLVGLSWGGGVAHTMLERHPDLVDRAVIDGAGLLSWWANEPFLAAITAITPFLHTRPVVALFGGFIGMGDEGKEDLRASSRRAFRRAFGDGFHVKPSAAELAAPCPTLLVAGEAETAVRPSNAAQASLMPHAVAVYAPGVRHGWLARQTDLHVRMVEAWLTGQDLPAELVPEPPAPFAVERLLRELGEETCDVDDRRATQPR